MKKYLIPLFLAGAAYAAPSDLLLSDFTTNQGVLQDTWATGATFNGGILTVVAKDTNGYIEFEGINATGYLFVAITAKVDVGNQSGFAIQFNDDNNLAEYTVRVAASAFSSTYSTVYVPLNWAEGSIGDLTAITSWSVGGGSVGSSNFNYSIDKIALVVSNSPVPEPSSFAALAGLAVLGSVATRRRRSA